MYRLSPGLRRQWLSLILAVVLGGLALNGLWGASGPRDLLVLRYHGRMMTEERDSLVLDNASLRRRIVRLKSDDAYLQQLIRLELGYVRSGELVYRFPKPEQPLESSKLPGVR
jgi:cell division protein FtsB